MYAGRKRRKPTQRTVNPLPAEGVKSNPSKRHRDRLNGELERLAGLLPFPSAVTASLDKLSILRLCVSYLRAKSFFSVAFKNKTSKGLLTNTSNHDNNKATELVEGWLPEGELLLQALSGFVLVVTSEGIIFYVSHTIQDYLGFHQTDVMHQSVFELIHTEDQQDFRRNLHWAFNPPPSTAPPVNMDGNTVSNSALVAYNPEQLPPENSSFLERSFVCRFRCLLDNSSGFLALSFQGRLKFLHGQNRRLDDGAQALSQLALFTVATPLQMPSILEIRTKNMIFRTKHKLDFTPMACDAKGKIVLGYTEAELRVRGSGYQFIHAADMLYCAENHVRMIKTGESGLTVFRLLTKENRWKWVQANARLVYKNGRPDYIIATQRPLGEEEGGKYLRKRSMHLPFTFTTGEALLYQTSCPVPGFPDNHRGKGKSSQAKKGKGPKGSREAVDPSSLLGAMMRQDESVYVCQPAAECKLPYQGNLIDEQGDVGSWPLPAVTEGWERASQGATGDSDLGMSSFDPLLATLDSLSLEGEECCSNIELFSALENLGLNAEDLELLLLDDRMIRMEMEPDRVPSLNDLLNNEEILSYVHGSLENQTSDISAGRQDIPVPEHLDPAQDSSGVTPHLPSTVTEPGPGGTSRPCLPHCLPRHPTPILPLSHQMQQYLSQKCHAIKLPQPSPVLENWLAAEHSGHWVPQYTQTQVDYPSQVKGKVQKINHQQHWHQGHILYKQNPSDTNGSSHDEVHSVLQWQGYNHIDQMDLMSSGPCVQDAHVDNNIASRPGVEFTVSSCPTGNMAQFQNIMATPSSYQQVYQMQQQPKVLSTCYSCTNQSSSLEAFPPEDQPSVGAFEIFDSAPPVDTTNSKVDNSCVLNSTSVAYTGSVVLPNGNIATMPGNSPHDCPEPRPLLPDANTTGFYL
ncbi:aryl hydrocarbon receptor 1b [Electrophorus electricus]|uniref:aryl hydrocarbon receptor 1b n=1 Tax=Electrophorus electricus TaxID=8005 RepID=UPI0015D07887|nr:aryl hydrocarbon receptor 1b [Electrophorus electricus]